MASSGKSTTVFSLKFSSNSDEFEVIAESDDNENANNNSHEKVDAGFESIFHVNAFEEAEKNEESLSLIITDSDSDNSLLHPCPKCNKECRSLAQYNFHVKMCNATKSVQTVIILTCPKCNKNYKSLAVYKRHVKQCPIPKSKPIPCLLDRKICFCCEEPLALDHTGPIRCNKCPKSFMTNKGLRRHLMFIHSNSRNFQCELCDAQCATHDILKLHRQAHNDELDRLEKNLREYKCCFCDKSFLEKTALAIHITTHKRNDQQASISYQCTGCKKALDSYEAFMTHACDSNDKFKYKCNLCNKLLSSKGFLQRHVNIHKKYNESVDSSDNNNKRENSKASHAAKMKLKIFDKSVAKRTTDQIVFLDDSPIDVMSDSLCSSQDFVIDKVKKNEYADDYNNCKTKNETRTEKTVQIDSKAEDVAAGNSETIKEEAEIIMDILVNESDIKYTFPMDDITLTESVTSLLSVLLDKDLLEQFGWPTAPIDKILDSVLKHCESTPATCSDFATQIRENVKLLLSVVIGNDSLKDFFKNNAIDTIIREIIKNSS